MSDQTQDTDVDGDMAHAAVHDAWVAHVVGDWIAAIVAVMPRFVALDAQHALQAAIARSAAMPMGDDQDALLAQVASAALSALSRALPGAAEHANSKA